MGKDRSMKKEGCKKNILLGWSKSNDTLGKRKNMKPKWRRKRIAHIASPSFACKSKYDQTEKVVWIPYIVIISINFNT